MPIQRFGQLNKLPIVIISINLFLIFLNIKVMNNKIINTISQCTFGVYLIHEHYLIREFLWKYLFNASRITSSLKLIMYAVAVTFIVYIVCTMIDLIREKLILLQKKIYLHMEYLCGLAICLMQYQSREICKILMQ